MDGLGWVVLWEGLALAAVAAGALLGEKAQRAVSWRFEFAVRLGGWKRSINWDQKISNNRQHTDHV